MKLFGWLRRPRMVPVAQFRDRSHAEAAWGRLQDAEIPAVVDGDPGLLGAAALTRVMVEAPNTAAAQHLIADLVRLDAAGGDSGEDGP